MHPVRRRGNAGFSYDLLHLRPHGRRRRRHGPNRPRALKDRTSGKCANVVQVGNSGRPWLTSIKALVLIVAKRTAEAVRLSAPAAGPELVIAPGRREFVIRSESAAEPVREQRTSSIVTFDREGFPKRKDPGRSAATVEKFSYHAFVDAGQSQIVPGHAIEAKARAMEDRLRVIERVPVGCEPRGFDGGARRAVRESDELADLLGLRGGFRPVEAKCEDAIRREQAGGNCD